MNENIELIEYLYQNAEMGLYSTKKLIGALNDKENTIKKDLELLLKGYEKYFKESKNIINKSKYKIKKTKLSTKIGSNMGIKMEVNKDNSDSAIAHLLIEGLTMGVVDITSKIKRYEKEIEKNLITLAKEYLSFQSDAINYLKKYL